MTDNMLCASIRIRMARNLRGYPFPARITDKNQFSEITEKVEAALCDKTDMQLTKISSLSPIERRRLVERHVISPELSKNEYGALIHTPDYKISVMINEEDHIRIQAVCEGFDIKRALMAAKEVDNMLSEELMIAYDDEFGYLTACPTNVGTAMRISAMLHLPALEATGNISEVVGSLNRMGYVVRGVYGEGSEAIGGFYQISNEITLGLTCEEIADDFKKVCEKVCAAEQKARSMIYEADKTGVEDKLMRSLGTLKYCRKLSSLEAVKMLSDVCLAVSLGIINGDVNELYSAFWEIMPACISKETDRAIDRDIKRAKYINDLLREV